MRKLIKMIFLFCGHPTGENWIRYSSLFGSVIKIFTTSPCEADFGILMLAASAKAEDKKNIDKAMVRLRNIKLSNSTDRVAQIKKPTIAIAGLLSYFQYQTILEIHCLYLAQ